MTLRSLLATEPRCGCPGSTALRVQRDILPLVECARCGACWVWARP